MSGHIEEALEERRAELFALGDVTPFPDAKTKEARCTDCGELFSHDPRGRKPTRCKECYLEYRRAYARNYWRENYRY